MTGGKAGAMKRKAEREVGGAGTEYSTLSLPFWWVSQIKRQL